MKKKYLVILIIINVIQSFLLISQTFLIKGLIDKAVNKENVIINIIIILSVMFLQILFRALYLIIRNKYNLKLEVYLKGNIFKELLKKEYSKISIFHSGELSNIYLNDVSNISNTLSNNIPNIFLYVSRFLFALIALILIDYRIVFVLIGIGIVLFIFSRLYSKYMKIIHTKALESDGNLNKYMQESFENIKLIKAMSATDSVNERLETELKNNFNAKKTRNRISVVGGIGINTIGNLCYGGTMCFAAYMLFQGKISYGTLTALVALVTYFESPFSALSGVVGKIYSYKASKERINNIFKIENEEESKEIYDFDKIIFNNVSFSYDQEIYKNFNYEINKNDIVVITGPSGVGKTTLINLLLGFIKPKEGGIIIKKDNNSYECGVSTRSLFSYVPQENILFSGTIYDNIKLFNPKKSKEQMIEALKLVQVYDELNDGLDQKINERGNGLSVGQIQRILIGISILRDSPILLMDEFSSALDKDNEKNIIDILTKLNKTIIMISHKNIFINNQRNLVIKGENNDN